VVWQRFASAHWEGVCKSLIERHVAETASRWAEGLLEDWERTRQHIWQVCPKEMISRLAHPLSDNPAQMVAAE
jgi:glutamate synthase (NADPH/NADH) large chain